MIPFKLAVIGLSVFSACLISSCSKSANNQPLAKTTESGLPGFRFIGILPNWVGPSEIFEGVWVSELEGSYFVEGDKIVRKYYTGEHIDTWLYPASKGMDFPQQSSPIKYESNYGTYEAHFAHVKFVGRRNLFGSSFGFGHLGVSQRVIFAERVLSFRPFEKEAPIRKQSND